MCCQRMSGARQPSEHVKDNVKYESMSEDVSVNGNRSNELPTWSSRGFVIADDIEQRGHCLLVTDLFQHVQHFTWQEQLTVLGNYHVYLTELERVDRRN